MKVTMKSSGSFDFDSILNALKWNGLYQAIQIVLNIGCSVPIAFSIMSIIFLGYNIPRHCKELNDTSTLLDHGVTVNISSANITYGECGITISSNQSHLTEDIQLTCVNGYEYHQPRDLSLNSDWDLVCGKESLSDLLQTLYVVGTGIGSLVFTILADKKGRKLSNCIAGLCFLAVSCGMAYVPNYISFAVLKVVQGAVQTGMSLTSTILYLEVVPTSHRSTIGVLATLGWALSVVGYAGVAYLMRDLSWRLHQLIIALTSAYYLLMPWILEESFRWLAAMKKYGVIEHNLRKAARMNGKNEETIVAMFRSRHGTTDIDRDRPEEDSFNKLIDDKKKEAMSEEKNFFTDKDILLISMIVWFMWITNTLTYYGLSLTSTEFHSDKYIGFGLSAMVEVLSAPAYWLTVDRFGRKRSCLWFHVLAGVSLILSAIFQHFSTTMPSFSVAVTTLTLIGKFAISTSFCVVWFYTPEMFPTTIRNFTVGIASLFARIGGVFAPFSRTLHRHYPWALGAIFGSFCLIVSVLVRFLPETTDQELPQTVADMKILLQNKELSKDKKKQPTLDLELENRSRLL